MNTLARGATIAVSALGLVGCRFRLHGRDPATGLDCVGVISAALATSGQYRPLPTDYALRMRDARPARDLAREFGFIEVSGQMHAGDAVLFEVGPCQFHVAVACGDGRFVHAHAGLKRVICSEPGQAWSVIGHWRLDESRSPH